MKKITLFVIWATCSLWSVYAQQGVTHSGHLTQQPPFPLKAYTELENPLPMDTAAWQRKPSLLVGWSSLDQRPVKESPAEEVTKQPLRLYAWRGERVSAQWIVSTKKMLQALTPSLKPLQLKKSKVKLSASPQLSFLRYVMTDELNKEGGGCGYRPDASKFDSSLVADVLDPYVKQLDVQPYTTRAGWVSIDVPEDAQPGCYQGELRLTANHGKVIARLPLQLYVNSRVLPQPKNWAFHLDLWQNPYAVARYYKVPLWSPAHFSALRPYQQHYQQMGGKVITASIMQRPWNGQTYDPFGSMVTWMKRSDGTWAFDYTIFDQWIAFNDSLGLTGQINCYTMIPWSLDFQYYDQATHSIQSIKTAPGEAAYAEMWTAMLTSFAKHLKEKGWFERTYISMDERPMKAMQEAIKVIKAADPQFKVALAGNLHAELIDVLDDYCIPIAMKYSEEQIESRRRAGKITTFYTCCTENRPNTFTFSPTAEAEWLPWYAAAHDLDGYLRWAYNSWVIEPLLDSRFYTWAAGDTYMIYPGPRSSVRLERLRDGIESYEKIRLLKKEWKSTQNAQALHDLKELLLRFDETLLTPRSAAGDVKAANTWLNQW